MRKPKGYWQEWKNVERELIPICKKLGRFPSNRELNKYGLTTIARYLTKYYGGIEKIAKKLGYRTYDQYINRHSQGFWTLECVINEYIDLIKSHAFEYWPSKWELIKLGRSDLYGAIYKFGGYSKFKRLIKAKKGICLEKRKRKIKWNDKLICHELRNICNKLGYFPSDGEFNQLGRVDLRGAIAKHGGAKKFANILKYQRKSEYKDIKKSGYWTDFSNIAKELEPIIVKIGHFPTYTELKIVGRTDIIGGLKWYGGIFNVAEKLGYELVSGCHLKTYDGHLVRSIFEVLVDNFFSMNGIYHETEGIIDKDSKRHFMYDFKVPNLQGIPIYFEIWGYRKDREQSDIEINYNIKRKLKEFLYSDRNLILVSIEEKIFNMTFKDIYDYLVQICIEKDIKHRNFNYRVNYIDLFISHAYSYEDLYEDLKPYIEELTGYMPTTTFLRHRNREDLITRIQKFGGFNLIRERFKLSKRRVEKKWDNDNLFLKEFLSICQSLGRVPSAQELLDMGRGDLLGAVNKRGGFIALSKELGYKTKSEYNHKKPIGFWKNWENLKNILVPICKELGRFPTRPELYDRNLKSVSSALYYFGGIRNVAEKLGYKTTGQYQPDWKDFEFVKNKLLKVVKQLGHFPTPTELRKLDLCGLKQAIEKYHGGFEKICQSLGYQLNYTPKNKYKDWDLVKNTVLAIKDKIGHFPKQNDFKRLGYSGLLISLYRYYDGLRSVKMKIQEESE